MKNDMDYIIDALFNSNDTIVTIKDNDLRYIRCSCGFENLVNAPWAGKCQENLLLCKNYKYSAKILKTVLKQKVAQTFVQTIYIDNVERHYKSTAIPIINKNKVSGILTISRDITETVALKNCLETYNLTMQHNLQISVIGQVRALKLLLSGQMGELNGEQREFLELISNSSNYLYSMMRNLLAVKLTK